MERDRARLWHGGYEAGRNRPGLALLRGVNVGGRNIILKDELVRYFEDLGFTGVRTYIQSGNVLFRSDETNVRALTDAVEKKLSDRCSAHVRAVVFPRSRYRSAVREGGRLSERIRRASSRSGRWRTT